MANERNTSGKKSSVATKEKPEEKAPMSASAQKTTGNKGTSNSAAKRKTTSSRPASTAKKTAPAQKKEAPVKEETVAPVKEEAVAPVEEKKPETVAPVESVTPVAAETAATVPQKSPLEAAFDEKKEKIKEFSAYKQLREMYGESQALNLLRRKILQYKEIDGKFLRKIEEQNAFRVEKVYVPVVRATANVRYEWKTKGEGEEFSHSEIKKTEKLFSDVGELDVLNYHADYVMPDKERDVEGLYKKQEYPIKKAIKHFNRAIHNASPNSHAKVDSRGDSYELIYIPVIKAICNYNGEDYIGYVNLVNGTCVSDYKISERLENAVNKVMDKAHTARLSLISSLLFVLTLCGLAVVRALAPNWNAWNFNFTAGVAGLAAIALVPILGIGYTYSYKDKRMKLKAVTTGKLPSAKGAKVVVVLGWLAGIGATLYFAYSVLLNAAAL